MNLMDNRTEMTTLPCGCLEETVNQSKVACIGRKDTFDEVLPQLGGIFARKLQLSEESLLPFGIGCLVPKGSPYRRVLDTVTLKAVSSGMPQAWLSKMSANIEESSLQRPSG